MKNLGFPVFYAGKNIAWSSKPPVQVLVVIHHRDALTTQAEAEKILAVSEVTGVMLVDHGPTRDEAVLFALAGFIQKRFPNALVGANALLSEEECFHAMKYTTHHKLRAVWFDHGLTPLAARTMKHLMERLPDAERPCVFDGVELQSPPRDHAPLDKARIMRARGVVPTLRGETTGVAPEVASLRWLSEDGTKPLAVASGVTPDNVKAMLPYVSHILVATGVARGFSHVDVKKLRALVDAVHG